MNIFNAFWLLLVALWSWVGVAMLIERAKHWRRSGDYRPRPAPQAPRPPQGGSGVFAHAGQQSKFCCACLLEQLHEADKVFAIVFERARIDESGHVTRTYSARWPS